MEISVSLYALVITFCVLATSTITDLKMRVIEPFLCLALLLAAFLDQPKDYVQSLFGLLIGFVPFFIIALAGHGGGGDALLAGAVGWTMHLYITAYTLLFSTALYAVVLIIAVLVTGDKKKQFPFAPFMLAGWIASLLILL